MEEKELVARMITSGDISKSVNFCRSECGLNQTFQTVQARFRLLRQPKTAKAEFDASDTYQTRFRRLSDDFQTAFRPHSDHSDDLQMTRTTKVAAVTLNVLLEF